MSTLDMWLDGAIASAVATVFSNPFDVIRTRMQLQGELLKTGQYHVVYRNMFQGLIRVSREEGVVALQKGLCTAMVWQVALNGVRVGLYPIAQSEVSLLCGQEYFLGNVAAGSICGFIGSYISSPFNLIKTRMQAMRNTMISLHGTTLTVASTGEQYAYKNLLDALRRIYSENGIRGLWHGSCIAAQRSMIGSGAQLSTYELTKQYVCFYFNRSPADFVVHLFSAFTAALFVVIFMNPLDVVMTRSFNHDVRSTNTYSANLALATWKIYRVEGIHGLYKGSEALFMRSAPHTIVTFVTLEWLRKMREKWFSDRSYTSGSVLKNKTSGVARDNINITNSGGDIKDNALQPTPELSKINKTMPMQESTSSSSHENFFSFVERMAVSFSANACAEYCELSDYTDTMKELTSAP